MEFDFQKHSLFRVGIWDDYETSAIMVAYQHNTIYVKRYMHCSCYGSDEAVLGGDYLDSPQSESFESIEWDWRGSPDKFAELAENNRDFKYPRRRVDRHDSDYTFVKTLYKVYLMWYRTKKPRWKDRIFNVCCKASRNL